MNAVSWMDIGIIKKLIQVIDFLRGKALLTTANKLLMK
jgi:hypothetical protein